MGKQVILKLVYSSCIFLDVPKFRNVMVPHWNATGNISIGQATGRIIMK